MPNQITAISEYPTLAQTPTLFSTKLATLFKAYGLVFLSLIFIAAPVVALSDKFVVNVLHFKSIMDNDKIAFRHLFEKTGYVKGLLYICLVGPILEETVFRLPLAFKRIPIAIGIAAAIFLFSTLLPSKQINASLGVLWVFAIRVVVAVLIFFILKKIIPRGVNLSKDAKKWIIITSMVLFGLMHIANYSPLQWPIIWVYPLYVVPQLIMGWLITYVRFKNGFVWGIALHCLINSGSMLLSSAYREPLKTKTAPITISAKKPAADTSSRLKKK